MRRALAFSTACSALAMVIATAAAAFDDGWMSLFAIIPLAVSLVASLTCLGDEP